MDYRAAKDFLTVTQITRKVSVSRATIRTTIRDGKLPGIKSGRKWFVKKEDFDAFYKNNPDLKKIKEFLNTSKRPFFTIEELMELFHAAYITVYRWLTRYYFLTFVKISRRLYVPRESVREFVTHNPEKLIFRHCYS